VTRKYRKRFYQPPVQGSREPLLPTKQRARIAALYPELTPLQIGQLTRTDGRRLLELKGETLPPSKERSPQQKQGVRTSHTQSWYKRNCQGPKGPPSEKLLAFAVDIIPKWLHISETDVRRMPKHKIMALVDEAKAKREQWKREHIATGSSERAG